MAKSPPTGAAPWMITAMPMVFVFLWSTGFLGAKFGLPYVEPFTFLLIRFVLVSAILLAASAAFSAPWPQSWGAVGHIAVAGLLVQAAYLGGVFSAIDAGLSAGFAALIVGLQPVLTALFAGPLFSETITRRQWTGIALGLIGLLMVLGPRLGLNAINYTGMGFAAIGLFGITAGTIYQKRFCADMDLRSGSAIQFISAGIVIGLLAVTTESMEVQVTGELIFAVTWLVIVLSIGAITLLTILIRRGAASKVASLFYLVTPVTALLAFFMFGEALGPIELAGIVVTSIGVFLVVRN